MNIPENIKKIQLEMDILSHDKSTIKERVNRYLEIDHQGIIGNHYFAKASSECLYLYRDGYFISAVMMSHAINEGIIKFVADRSNISRKTGNGNTKTIKETINDLQDKNVISDNCAESSKKIWCSFRNDIHHMNPKVSGIDFKALAKKNLKYLSVIEKEIFEYDIKNGKLSPHYPKYWDKNKDGTTTVDLRLE